MFFDVVLDDMMPIFNDTTYKTVSFIIAQMPFPDHYSVCEGQRLEIFTIDEYLKRNADLTETGWKPKPESGATLSID
jgi:protein involved in sex pheromone biosynthesis